MSKANLPLLSTVLTLTSSAIGPADLSTEAIEFDYKIMPLAVEADPETKDLLPGESFFEKLKQKGKESETEYLTKLVEPHPSINYKILKIQPNPDIDYKILRIAPKPNIDYKIRILEPNNRISSTELSTDLTGDYSQFFEKTESTKEK